MEASVCIHTGMTPLRDTVSRVKNVPATSVANTACPEARRAESRSPAPRALAI